MTDRNRVEIEDIHHILHRLDIHLPFASVGVAVLADRYTALQDACADLIAAANCADTAICHGDHPSWGVALSRVCRLTMPEEDDDD